MFTIRTFTNSLSICSASIMLAFVCIGLLMGCSGDVGSPEFHVSGAGSKVRNPDFTAENIVETEFPVENLVSTLWQSTGRLWLRVIAMPTSS